MTETNETPNKIRRNLSFNVEAMTVRVAEHTGTHTTEDYDELWFEEYNVGEWPEAMRKRSELHGAIQKLTDCTAGMSDAKGHTTEERREKINELAGQIENGDWNKRSEGAGSKLSQTQIKSKMGELGLSDDQYALAVKMGLIKA